MNLSKYKIPFRIEKAIIINKIAVT